MASNFQVKTDPNQVIKQTCLRKKFTTRPLLPFLEIKEVSLAITHYLKNFPPIPRFVSDPIPKNENAESAESFITFFPLFQ